jgi:hypothetical protein
MNDQQRDRCGLSSRTRDGAIEVSRTDPLLGQRLFAWGCSLIRKDEALERPGFLTFTQCGERSVG